MSDHRQAGLAQQGVFCYSLKGPKSDNKPHVQSLQRPPSLSLVFCGYWPSLVFSLPYQLLTVFVAYVGHMTVSFVCLCQIPFLRTKVAALDSP